MSATATFSAFGGQVLVAVAQPGSIGAAARLARAEADAFDRACSRFRLDSELTLLNAAAGTVVRVGALLAAAIEVGLQAAAVSDGMVDFTVGGALKAAGYDRDFRQVRRWGGPVAPGVGCPGWRSVMFDAARREVRLTPGTSIDLGATGKALFADRAARLVLEHTGSGTLVSAGGDIAVAGTPPSGGWLVGLAEHHAGQPTSAVYIDRGGVATSGTSARSWRRGKRRFHHIIDPRTGFPADTRWRTVTVAAGSAVDANIAATTAVILGAQAPSWLRRHHLPALLIDRAGREVRSCGWPDPDLRAYAGAVA